MSLCSVRGYFMSSISLIISIAGYRTAPTYSAQLNGWYSLVREKRSTRQDFLKALVKALDIEVSPASMTQV